MNSIESCSGLSANDPDPTDAGGAGVAGSMD